LAATIHGPAIIEQMDTTILIPPGDRAEGGADGNIVIHLAKHEGHHDAA
jgi:N-methylhydantoinase A